jgi:2-keto-4-pentenoate hydratase/2-oxohepta-3-ene-1,7-dioic acid hydratase in catechol pathway
LLRPCREAAECANRSWPSSSTGRQAIRKPGVRDPQQLVIRLSVNGEVKQDGSTSDMVIDIGHLIAGASRAGTLLPGDVILTGTPAGVGMPSGEFLSPGDTVIVEIDGIGTLRNQVIPA